MKLIIIRHGKTVDNAKNILQGQTHGRLNNTGIKQAKKAALWLKDENIDFAYSSDLKRAVDTAEEILKYHPKLKLKTDKALREISRGEWDGKHYSFFKAHKKTIKGSYHTYRPKNGESWDDVYKRMSRFYKRLIKKKEGKTILIVSHGGAISCMLAYLHDETSEKYKKFHPKNTAITFVKIDDRNRHRITLLNALKHL